MKLDHLVRLISQQWAISPDVLEGWCQILDAKLAGNAIPPELIAAGSLARNTDELFVRDGNVAIIPLVGTLVKANSLFSCDATYAQFRQAVAAALSAKGIDALMIDGDTPGGTVAGAQETGDYLYRVGQQKPLYGWVDDLAASAGYWLLAQTRMIGAHAAADTGSLGVLTVSYDRSGRDQQAGVKRTVLAVGDFKAAGNDTGPLSDDDRAYIMGRLHTTYDLFKSAVNRGRPQLSLAAINDMQSRIYKSAEAQKLGLIDHIMGKDEYIDLVKRQTRGAVVVPLSKGVKAMNLETFKAEHHDLFAQIEAAARQGMIASADAATAQAQAVTAESTRVLALVSATLGAETGKKLETIVSANLSAEQVTALGLTIAPVAATADGQTQAEMLAAITAAAADGLKPGTVKGDAAAEERKSTVSAIAAGGSVK